MDKCNAQSVNNYLSRLSRDAYAYLNDNNVTNRSAA